MLYRKLNLFWLFEINFLKIYVTSIYYKGSKKTVRFFTLEFSFIFHAVLIIIEL